MKFSCVKMADKVLIVGKSALSKKANTTFSEEETEELISLWSEEEVLFNSCNKDYFKKNARRNAINRTLLRLHFQYSVKQTNV